MFYNIFKNKMLFESQNVLLYLYNCFIKQLLALLLVVKRVSPPMVKSTRRYVQ